jgi:3-methyladenine DNA glycosylase Mpg
MAVVVLVVAGTAVSVHEFVESGRGPDFARDPGRRRCAPPGSASEPRRGRTRRSTPAGTPRARRAAVDATRHRDDARSASLAGHALRTRERQLGQLSAPTPRQRERAFRSRPASADHARSGTTRPQQYGDEPKGDAAFQGATPGVRRLEPARALHAREATSSSIRSAAAGRRSTSLAASERAHSLRRGTRAPDIFRADARALPLEDARRTSSSWTRRTRRTSSTRAADDHRRARRLRRAAIRGSSACSLRSTACCATAFPRAVLQRQLQEERASSGSAAALLRDALDTLRAIDTRVVRGNRKLEQPNFHKRRPRRTSSCAASTPPDLQEGGARSRPIVTGAYRARDEPRRRAQAARAQNTGKRRPRWSLPRVWRRPAPRSSRWTRSQLARALLGTVLVHRAPDGIAAGRIVENRGVPRPRDAASHSFRGQDAAQTRRAFAALAGIAVRLPSSTACTGCVNVVSARVDRGEAGARARDFEPMVGLERMRRAAARRRRSAICSVPRAGEPRARARGSRSRTDGRSLARGALGVWSTGAADDRGAPRRVVRSEPRVGNPRRVRSSRSASRARLAVGLRERAGHDSARNTRGGGATGPRSEEPDRGSG